MANSRHIENRSSPYFFFSHCILGFDTGGFSIVSDHSHIKCGIAVWYGTSIVLFLIVLLFCLLAVSCPFGLVQTGEGEHAKIIL